MADVALYHPAIDPDDSVLIRTAALYWDQLQTIVPESIKDPFHSETAVDAQRVGFLKARRVSPDDPAVIAASNEIIADRERQAVRSVAEDATDKAGMALWRIHPEKMSDELRSCLFASHDVGGVGFLRASGGFVSAYMSRLAAQLALADGSSPLTNRKRNHDVVVDGLADVLPDESGSEGTLVMASLSLVSITAATPLEEVLHFRDKHRSQLQNLRKAVKSIVPAGRASAPKEIRRIVVEEVLPALDDLKHRLSEGQIGFGLATLDVAQAVVIGAIASGFADFGTGALAGGVSLSINYYRHRRERADLLRTDPWSYLLLAQRQLG